MQQRKRQRQQSLIFSVCRCIKCEREFMFEPQPRSTVRRHEHRYGIRLTEEAVVFDVAEQKSTNVEEQKSLAIDDHQAAIQIEEELREVM